MPTTNQVTWILRAAAGVGIAWVATAGAGPVPITALSFTPDGLALVSNGARSLEVRSPSDGIVQRSIPCELAKISALTFNPTGDLLAVAGGSPTLNGEVRVLDWRAEQMRHRIANHTDLCTAVAFNADGSVLGVAGADHLARLWRLDGTSCSEIFTLAGHAGPVLAIAFSPTGELCVTASADRSVKVWSTQDGTLLRTFNHHTEAVHAVAFRPQPAGKTFPVMCASGSDDRTVRIWQPGIGRMVRIIRHHIGPILALAYSPDGSALFSGGQEGIIRQLDPESDAILAEWSAHTDWVYALAVSPDGARFASGDWEGNVQVRRL